MNDEPRTETLRDLTKFYGRMLWLLALVGLGVLVAGLVVAFEVIGQRTVSRIEDVALRNRDKIAAIRTLVVELEADHDILLLRSRPSHPDANLSPGRGRPGKGSPGIQEPTKPKDRQKPGGSQESPPPEPDPEPEPEPPACSGVEVLGECLDPGLPVGLGLVVGLLVFGRRRCRKETG